MLISTAPTQPLGLRRRITDDDRGSFMHPTPLLKPDHPNQTVRIAAVSKHFMIFCGPIWLNYFSHAFRVTKRFGPAQ